MKVYFQLLLSSLFFVNISGQGSGNGSPCDSAEDGSIRLYNIHNVTGEGAVQQCYNGVWYSVCDYGWGCPEANVVCKQLGYTKGARSSQTSAYYYFGYWYNIRPYYYYCYGGESSLDYCSYNSAYYSWYCDQNYDAAGVRCYVSGSGDSESCSNNGDVRLVDGTDTEGRLEYCYNHEWSSVCTRYYFNDEEASVACKQLGYSAYASIVYDSAYYCDGGDCANGAISYFTCSTYGTETSLSECTLHPLTGSSYSCASSCTYPVAIRCYAEDGCTDGAVQLVNGTIDQEGRIEVCVGGVWGSICNDYYWDKSDAFVICRQLGYPNTVPDISRVENYGNGDNPIVYAHVSCDGFETSISDCNKAEYLYYYSCYYHAAGVLCTDGCVENSLRIVGGDSEVEGTVEVCVNNMWGLIGDGGWDNRDADVVCRQLGLPSGGAIAILNSKKTDRVTVHYSYVLCEGDEPLLERCQKVLLSLDEGNAAFNEATVGGVVCAEASGPPRYPDCLPQPQDPPTENECTDGDVKIMDDGETLEYCYNGHWTGLCTMTHHEAMVACKQLGYTQYTWGLLYDNYQDVNQTAPSYNSSISNVTCSGKESSLRECTAHKGECLSQCPKPFGLKCFEPAGCSEGAVRLKGGIIEQEGRVEVCVNGVWGSICDFGWDKSDAHVACQQLGYNEIEPIAYTGSTFGETEGPLVYSHVSCGGWEKSLSKCTKLDYESFTCPHYTVAGVMCTNGCTPNVVRLVNGKSENEGTVEICVDGLWGLISDGQWSSSDAEVVCRQLGYSDTSGSVAFNGSHYGKPHLTIHVGNVNCHGDEKNLPLCSMTIYSLDDGKKLQDNVNVAGVSCVAPVSSTPISSSTSSTPISSNAPITNNNGNGSSPLLVAILVIVCVGFAILTVCIIAFIAFIVNNKRQKATASRNLPSVVMSRTINNDDDDYEIDNDNKKLLQFSEDSDVLHQDGDDELLT